MRSLYKAPFLRGALSSGPARFSIILQSSGFVNRQFAQIFGVFLSQNCAKCTKKILHKNFFCTNYTKIFFVQIFFCAFCWKSFFSKMHNIFFVQIVQNFFRQFAQKYFFLCKLHNLKIINVGGRQAPKNFTTVWCGLSRLILG